MHCWLKRLRAVAFAALLAPIAYGAVQMVAAVDAGHGAAFAQTSGAVPGEAIGGSSDSDTWRAIRRGVPGTVSIPDRRAAVMIQSEGESWRAMRNGPVSVYGGWLLGGVLVLLALFFLYRGRIRIDGGFSGRTIERFDSVERFAHWLTATSFIVLGLTGLNMMYGRYVIRPLIGPEWFSLLTGWGKYAHNYVGFAFIVGIVMILIIWVRDNLPSANDLTWLAKGGGMFTRGTHVPARKFNAGQKIIFWLVVLAGTSISFTGLSLMFPFTFAPFSGTFAMLNAIGFDLPTNLSPMSEMQLTQLWHAILSLFMIAVTLAHIYIGTLGMEGAYDAMGSGFVDENWAREHHSLWMEEVETDLRPSAAVRPVNE